MDNPCKDCVAPKRHIGCHGKCKEYISWAEHNREMKSQCFNAEDLVWREYYRDMGRRNFRMKERRRGR